MATAKTNIRRMSAIDTETARKIWLAGVGAYGRAFDTARTQIGKVNHDATEYFDDLVNRGEKIEGQVRDHIESNAQVQKVTKRAEKMTARATKAAEQQRDFVESRMANLRETLEMPMGIMALSRKVRSLSTELEDVRAELAELKGSKPAKRTAKKATAKRAPKAAAKKAAPKKAAKRTAKKTAKRTTKRTTKRAAK